MALKTFNVDHNVYKKYAEYCKKEGISMSKRVENFIRDEVENLKIGDKKGEVKISDQKTEHSFGKYC